MGQDRLRSDLIDSNQSRQRTRKPVVKPARLQMELKTMTALSIDIGQGKKTQWDQSSLILVVFDRVGKIRK